MVNMALNLSSASGTRACNHGPMQRLWLGVVIGCTGSVDPRVTESGPVECGSERTTVFTRTVLGEEWRRTGNLTEGGRGVTVADFDGDGVLDLFVPQTEPVSRLLRGRGDGTFDDVTETAMPEGGLRDAFGASAADFDGDADLDLVVYRAREPVTLLVNDGAGTFTARAEPSWDPQVAGCGGAAAWADFDLDGDLDLFYGRLGINGQEGYSPCDSTLLRNDGGGAFAIVNDLLTPDLQYLRVMAAGWHQIDDDPEPELYVVADLPEVLDGNLLLDNTDGVLTQLEGTGTEVSLAGMGLAAGDLNGDGITDFAVPGIDEIALLQSSESGIWVDVAQSKSLVPDVANRQRVAWGGQLVDLDNDGLLDLPMGYGAIPQSSNAEMRQADEIYRNTGEAFERVGAAWGFGDDNVIRGYVVADLDGNGWLDVVKRELGGRVVVYQQHCDPGAHWLAIRLHDAGANAFGVGATITVEAGDLRLQRTVEAGSTSFNSGGPPQVHVGLGTEARVDAIEVRWPDGRVTEHRGMDADQWVDIRSTPP